MKNLTIPDRSSSKEGPVKDTTGDFNAVTEKQEAEYCYMCGGIQPVILPEMDESEEDE